MTEGYLESWTVTKCDSFEFHLSKYHDVITKLLLYNAVISWRHIITSNMAFLMSISDKQSPFVA